MRQYSGFCLSEQVFKAKWNGVQIVAVKQLHNVTSKRAELEFLREVGLICSPCLNSVLQGCKKRKLRRMDVIIQACMHKQLMWV